MTSRSLVLVPALIFVTTVSLGCPKKQPQTAPPPAPAPVAVPAPEPPPAPPSDPTAGDPVATPLDADIAAADRYAHANGLLGDVYFDLDKSELRADARERLAKNGEFLRERSEFQVRIEGHCDERGTNDYNLALGQSRAAAVHDYLVALGIASSRLQVVSLGEERPLCTESRESCWQQNRRAHFSLVGRVSPAN